MHKGYLVGAVILLALAVTCMSWTTVQVVQGKFGLASVNFLLAIVFHLATGAGGAFLFAKAHGARQKAPDESNAADQACDDRQELGEEASS